jgi:hypothetical protein
MLGGAPAPLPWRSTEGDAGGPPRSEGRRWRSAEAIVQAVTVLLLFPNSNVVHWLTLCVRAFYVAVIVFPSCETTYVMVTFTLPSFLLARSMVRASIRLSEIMSAFGAPVIG